MLIKAKVMPRPRDRYDEDLQKILEELINEIKTIANGGIVFSDNLNGKFVTFTTPAEPIEFTVAHTLGKVPTAAIITAQSTSGHLFKGQAAWTASNVYFQCSESSVTYTIMLF